MPSLFMLLLLSLILKSQFIVWSSNCSGHAATQCRVYFFSQIPLNLVHKIGQWPWQIGAYIEHNTAQHTEVFSLSKRNLMNWAHDAYCHGPTNKTDWPKALQHKAIWANPMVLKLEVSFCTHSSWTPTFPTPVQQRLCSLLLDTTC